MALLMNKGRREWLFEKDGVPFKPGDKPRQMKEGVAEKFAKMYPREFEVIQTEVKEEKSIVMSKNIKDLIKGIKGVGIPTALKMFEDNEAYSEDDQLQVLENFQNEE